MIPRDLFEKVRRIEISTSRLVTDLFAGQYHSVFKGRGIEFDEVREYQWGDDVRMIDWNVTARTGIAHIKKFVEEREQTVMLIVDASRSCQFGTVHELKSKLAAEMAAVLALSAIRNNDKVGLMIFTDQVEKFIPPRKGLRHVLRVIREVLYFKAKGQQTDIIKPLEFLSKVTTRKTVAFIISDFFVSTPKDGSSFNKKSDLLTSVQIIEPVLQENGGRDTDNHSASLLLRKSVKHALAIANKRLDLIAITLNDPKEFELPDCSLLHLEDPETGEMFLVDSSSETVRQQYKENSLNRLRKRDALFRSVGVDHVDVSTAEPYANALVKFFLSRRRRLR